MQRKDQIIEDIREFNASAHRDWLALFDIDALERYLAHLRWKLQPRGRHSIWIRDGHTPAMITRQPAD